MDKKGTFFPWLICAIGALFYCYEYLLRMSPSVMASGLMSSFNIDAATLGNLAAFYYYAYTPMQLPVGVMMDRYGPRRLLTVAALVCAFGTFIFAHSTLHMAYIGRFLVGFGSAFAFVGVLKLAALWLPENRFALVAGLATTLGMIGAIGGDISMTNLVNHLGWRRTVDYSALLGIVVAAVIWFVIPEPERKAADDQKIQGMSFTQLLVEALEVIKKPQMWLIGFTGYLMYLSLSVFAELWGVPYLERARGLSTVDAASVVSMVFLGWAVGGPIAGWVSDKFQMRRRPIIVGCIGALLSISAVLYLPTLTSLELSIALFLFGVFCSAESITFAMARDINRPGLTGTAMAVTNMLVMLSGVIFQPLLGIYLNILSGTHVTGQLAVYSGKNFQDALIILPLGVALAGVLMLFVGDTSKKKVPNPSENLTDGLSQAA